MRQSVKTHFTDEETGSTVKMLACLLRITQGVIQYISEHFTQIL